MIVSSDVVVTWEHVTVEVSGETSVVCSGVCVCVLNVSF